MISPWIVTSFGVAFGLLSFFGMFIVSEFCGEVKMQKRFSPLILGLCSASIFCGFIIGSRSLSFSVIGTTCLGCVFFSTGAYANFLNIKIPIWYPAFIAVPSIFLGIFSGSFSSLFDGFLLSLPFGITAIFLRKSKFMVSETIVSFSLGSFFGIGFGFVVVTLSSLFAVIKFRKSEGAVTSLSFTGPMYVFALAVTTVASLFYS